MIKKIFSNEFVRGGLSLFILFNVFNSLNFIFQFSMVRLLGLEDYATFAVLMALIYFLAIPSESIQAVVTKYTSKFNSRNEFGKIKYLLNRFILKGTRLTLLVFILLAPFMYLFSLYLNISFFLVLLTGIGIFPIFMVSETRGVMQGMKKFTSLGWNMVVDASVKVIISVLLVLVGMRIYGAIIGLITGFSLAVLISFIPLRKVLSSKKEKADISKIKNYGSSILLMLISIMAVQSIDVVLAKRFFSDLVAGQYAVGSLMGKIIFFGTIAISRAMFPFSSEGHERGIDTIKILQKSILAVSILSLFGLLIYGFFSEQIVRILSPNNYLETSKIVLNMGIAFTFISLANVMLYYAISINKKIMLWQLIVFVFSQVFLLWFLGNDIYGFSIAMIITGILMFMGSLTIVIGKKNET